MSNELSRLQAPKRATSSQKRVGRGPGSGLGKTSGRGHKGAGARSGKGIPARFEGGQMPLSRRLPKVGFNNIFKIEYEVVNLSRLAKCFSSGEVSLEQLVEKGLVKAGATRVKILGTGELPHSLTIHAHSFSASAKLKIEAVGGKAVEISAKQSQ